MKKMSRMNRKNFLKKGLLGSGLLAVSPKIWADEPTDNFDAEEIKAFVWAAHKDFDETRRIIEANPLLLNCTNQSSRGDFETALGGASHMGRRDIADLLVGLGARMDIFNFAFLGYSQVVQRLVNDHAQLLHAPGPHGFTLLHHAQAGEVTELEDWLQEKGLTETWVKTF